MSDAPNPYLHFQGTPEWTQIDRALRELSSNKDVVETTSHAYVVGYICQALANSKQYVPSPERRREALKALQDMVSRSELRNRDLVGELIAERRQEAARE